MQSPLVILRTPDGEAAPVGPGGLIGRLASATLCIDDPRISEAHAMVSLRGGRLVLLALRGGLRVASRRVSRVDLDPGVKVELVDGLALEVVAVELPPRVLGLAVGSHPPEALVASVYSVTGGALAPGFDEAAEAHLWASADGWRARLRGEEAVTLRPGLTLTTASGLPLAAREVNAVVASVDATVASAAERPPLRLVARFETVHLHRADGASVLVPGIPARAICELVDYNAPVPWEMVARTIWPDEDDRHFLRQNWDRHQRALRKRLREAGLRDDIVRPDGRGNVELFLMPGDQVIDER